MKSGWHGERIRHSLVAIKGAKHRKQRKRFKTGKIITKIAPTAIIQDRYGRILGRVSLKRDK